MIAFNRQLLTYSDLAERLGVSEMTLRRWCYSGAFPKPLRLGYNTVRFDPETIEEYLKTRQETDATTTHPE